MQPHRRTFAAFCVFACLATSASAGLILAENGLARATIVIADAPSDQAREAATVIQEYLGTITGAAFAITPESEAPSGNLILVGRSAKVSDLGVALPAGLTPRMEEEGFVVKTAGNNLILAGNEDWEYRGTLFAVYDFLEQDLGCRWFFPGAWGEVLPKSPTISLPDLDRTERPSFRVRDIWYSGWMPSDASDQTAFRAWYDKNKLNRFALNLPGDGSVSRLAPADSWFETHPEIYAVDEKGERQRDMLCMTEPEAVRIGAETIKQFFREDPTALTFGFAPPDGHPMCYCEGCQRFFPGFSGKGYGDPSLSDVWFHFANQVAEEVYKEFPERWVLTNGYANRVRPPEVLKALSPNLGIQSAMLATCTLHRIGDPKCWQRIHYKQVLDRWTEALDPILIYDYDPGKALENLPFPTLHCLKADFPYFRDAGIWGFWTEGTNSWMVTHLNYYVRAKLMWDADASVEGLVRDYCERFYGAASTAVESYLWTLEDAVDASNSHGRWGELTDWRSILTPVQDQLSAFITQAESQVEAGPARDHLHVLRLVHDHMMAYLAMENAAVEGDYAESVRQADRMFAIREEVCAIQPGLLPRSTQIAADHSSSLEKHREIYQGLLERSQGPLGDRVTMLPREWEFKLDPEDVGTLYRWYLPDAERGWTPIDTTQGWEAQGFADEKGWFTWGKAWYRTQFDVPAAPAESSYRLTLGGVYNTGVWIWVNGVQRPFRAESATREGFPQAKFPFDVDVSDLIRPGETNHVAVLVDIGVPGRNTRAGLHRRAFLWSPR
jgi:hypothetical protein